MATLQGLYTASPAPTIVFMGFFRSIRTYCIPCSSAPKSGFPVFPKTKLENPAVGVARCTDFRLPYRDVRAAVEAVYRFQITLPFTSPAEQPISDYPPVHITR